MSLLQDRLVLVVGAQCSGTTWVQRAVAAHPDVLAIPSETHLFSSAMSVLRDQAQGGLVRSPATGTWFMPREDFAAAARSFCDAALGAYVTSTRPDAARVVERSPAPEPKQRRLRRGATPAPPCRVHVGKDAQRLVDGVLEELAAGETARLAAALAPGTVIRLRDGAADWRLLGEDDHRKLLAHLTAQGAWGEPLRGEQTLATTT